MSPRSSRHTHAGVSYNSSVSEYFARKPDLPPAVWGNDSLPPSWVSTQTKRERGEEEEGYHLHRPLNSEDSCVLGFFSAAAPTADA